MTQFVVDFYSGARMISDKVSLRMVSFLNDFGEAICNCQHGHEISVLRHFCHHSFLGIRTTARVPPNLLLGVVFVCTWAEVFIRHEFVRFC